MKGQSLKIQQLSAKMKTMAIVKNMVVPSTGWIRAIRLALGMSAEQLGAKLSITRQSIYDMEKREQEGTISLKTLRDVAKALDMQLVYGFVPIDENLEALIERKATQLAQKIIQRASHSMQLEDQENTRERIQNAIRERAIALQYELPKTLWD